jgi:DivIVA domain-containing protein
MEVTPKVFRDVQFREKLRGGYHPEDVDEFLEQAALGVEVLQDRLRQATERAQRAEQAAAEASAADEVLRRTLVVAQRTADQVVREAREEAARTLADARAQAETILAEGVERGRLSYEQSVAEGRSTLESAQTDLVQAQQEVDALRAWIDEHRAHLISSLRDAQVLVEAAGLKREPPPVTVSIDQDAPGSGAPDAASSDEADGGRAAPGSGVEGSSDWPFAEDMAVGVGDAADQEPTILPPPPAEPGEGDPQAAGTAVEAAAGPGARTDWGSRPGEPTMAVDERALDSFFSEQDLGDERRLGRLRHRH